MRLRFRQFCALAGLTATEIMRHPVCLILVTSCVVLMGLAPLQAYQFGEDGKLARDSALAVHFLVGLFIGGYAACTVLTRELKEGTASVVLCKPVGRELFFLAKYAGVALVILLFSLCAVAATLLCEKAAPKGFVTDWLAVGVLLGSPLVAYGLAGAANYFMKRPFVSTAFWLLLFCVGAGLVLSAALYDKESAKRLVQGQVIVVDNAIQWRLVPAGALITMALLVLTAVALALATRLDAIPVLAICGAVLFAGLTADYLVETLAAGRPVGHFIAGLLPDWQAFWLADALVARGTVKLAYVAAAGIYAVMYLAAVLGAGVLSFRYREVR